MADVTDDGDVMSAPDRTGQPVPILLALIALADFLTFDVAPGLNLIVFALALAVAILAGGRRRGSLVTSAMWLAGLIIALVPLLEAPSAMAQAIAMFAMILLALAAADLVPVQLTALPRAVLGFCRSAPSRLIADCVRHFASRSHSQTAERLSRGLVIWMVPAAFASVFLSLFAIANPLIKEVLERIDLQVILRLLHPLRVSCWLLVAVLIWPFLRPRIRQVIGKPLDTEPVAAGPESILLGYASILRSLALFNALFAVQTLLDLIYLWGDATLPDGLSHAEYAHQGAYPLLATAVLSAIFVLISMRRDGPGEGSLAIRSLVYLWIGQIILLCFSAILRLNLYVSIYSLTEFRMIAAIWMGLVAVGLLLILLQIFFRNSNEWLIATNLGILLATIYICALVDVPSFIARFNVSHSLEITGQGTSLDLNYLASLGPSAIPALDLYLEKLSIEDLEHSVAAHTARQALANQFGGRSGGWRSWNFRDYRLEQYLSHSSAVASQGSGDDN